MLNAREPTRESNEEESRLRVEIPMWNKSINHAPVLPSPADLHNTYTVRFALLFFFVLLPLFCAISILRVRKGRSTRGEHAS